MVRYRTRARDDIENIYHRIARDMPRVALRVEDGIRAAAELLASRPELGVATGHRDVRRWPMPDFRYTIFYRISTREYIDVLRVIDARRVRNLKRVPR